MLYCLFLQLEKLFYTYMACSVRNVLLVYCHTYVDAYYVSHMNLTLLLFVVNLNSATL